MKDLLLCVLACTLPLLHAQITHSGRTLPPWKHRGYLGWIRDLATEPAPPDALWPYLRTDARLVEDYRVAARMLAAHGGNEVQIFGLFAAGNGQSPGYALDVEQTASPERLRYLRAIVDALHAQHLKVIAGVGGMSWGFDQIVRAHPELGCSNSPLLADPAQEASWQFQQRIIDLQYTLPIDGITIQSADQGRCASSAWKSLSDVEYHARIVDRMARYIRQHHPHAIIGSATYGVSFARGAQDLPAWKVYTRHLDYVIDVGETARNAAPGFRAQLVRDIAPALLGSEADPGPIAPVHFDRLSWFVPTFQQDIAALQRLYADGGRAAENYMRMEANPADRVSIRMVLRYEANPASGQAANLNRVLNEIYGPRLSPAALRGLRSIFVNTERTYFAHALHPDSALVERYYDNHDRGMAYLRDNLDPAGREAYRAALLQAQGTARQIAPAVPIHAALRELITTLGNVITSIDRLDAAPARLSAP